MMDDRKVLDALKDIIWLNAVVASEIIRVTENTRSALGSSPAKRCKEEHKAIVRNIIRISEKWKEDSQVLRVHNLKHK